MLSLGKVKQNKCSAAEADNPLPLKRGTCWFFCTAVRRPLFLLPVTYALSVVHFYGFPLRCVLISNCGDMACFKSCSTETWLLTFIC